VSGLSLQGEKLIIHYDFFHCSFTVDYVYKAQDVEQFWQNKPERDHLNYCGKTRYFEKPYDSVHKSQTLETCQNNREQYQYGMISPRDWC